MDRLPELGALRAELRAAGIFEHRELRSWLKLIFLVSAVGVSLAIIATYGLLAALVLVPVCSVLCTSIAMMGHEGSHKSFSASPVRNAILTHFTFPLFSGLSALYWHNKHDRLHHGHPNVEGVDPDIKPFPFVSSRGDHVQCGPKSQWFQRNLQKYVFWPMSTLMALGMRRSSLLYVMRFPKEHGFTVSWFAEVTCLLVHYTCWMVLPMIIWGPLIGVAVYSAIWAGVGVFLALVFAPAHMGLPITNGQNRDWIHQLETTRNLELPRVISYFFIGLDYQVEHHLFPKIPHQNLPLAAKITRDWCKRHEVPHISVPYLFALKDSAKFMAEAWAYESRLPIDIRAAHLVI